MSLRLLADVSALSKRIEELRKHYDQEIETLKKEIAALQSRKPGRPKHATSE